MVSKAREDLPEPERPVITVKLLRGISTLMFLRLCWRAPRTTNLVNGIDFLGIALPRAALTEAMAHSGHTKAKLTSYNNRWDSDWSNGRRILKEKDAKQKITAPYAWSHSREVSGKHENE